MITNLLEKNTYKVYCQITGIGKEFWKGTIRDFIAFNLNKLNKNRTIETEIEGQRKKIRILEVNSYISTDINGKRNEGLVFTIEPLQNPIPVALLPLIIQSVVYIILGILIYLSIDKIDEVVTAGGGAIREVGGVIEKSYPALLIGGGILLAYYFIRR